MSLSYRIVLFIKRLESTSKTSLVKIKIWKIKKPQNTKLYLEV